MWGFLWFIIKAILFLATIAGVFLILGISVVSASQREKNKQSVHALLTFEEFKALVEKYPREHYKVSTMKLETARFDSYYSGRAEKRAEREEYGLSGMFNLSDFPFDFQAADSNGDRVRIVFKNFITEVMVFFFLVEFMASLIKERKQQNRVQI